ncbi:MAG TPA: DUF447 domain-containing protein [Candidatus Polarisedimenticolia bacterium]|nr:DUF447 domain-containing protein [Candidatus Polarisedimenticolia bacterium]
MILETLVTTVDAGGQAHCAPMGIVPEGEGFLLKPFRTAGTCANLEATGEGVVNFTDDVLLFARSALSPFVPKGRPAEKVLAPILEAACSWREFRVAARELGPERALFRAQVVAAGRARDFLGYNRAQHAVIEATILATRLHLLDAAFIRSELDRLRPPVDKTAGPVEREAFDFVRAFVESGGVQGGARDGARREIA